MLCCQLSVLLMIVCCTAHLQQGFCLQKIFCASKRLVLLTLHDLQRPADVFHVLWWYCHRDGILTAEQCSMLPFPWQGSRTCPTLQAPTPHSGIAKPCHCKRWWRKDKGQRLSVLAGCSIASTAIRKLISIHKNHKICIRHTVRTQLY